MFDEEIKRGAALLDRKNPGWVAKIDITQLDLTSSIKCVLGQVYGDNGFVSGFSRGITALRTLSEMNETHSYGFSTPRTRDYPQLTVAWREYIAKRRLNELTERHTQEEREVIPV